MSSRIHLGKTTNKKVLHKKQPSANIKSHTKMKNRMKVEEDDDSDDSRSLECSFPIDYSTDATEDTNDTSYSSISQEFSDEEKVMKYYESKVRGNGLFELASDESSAGSDLPRRLKEMMNGFRKQNSQSRENSNLIPCKLSIEQTDKKPTSCTSTPKRKIKGGKAVSNRKVSEHGSKHQGRSSTRYNESVKLSGERRMTNNEQRVPPKDEAVFQKSSYASFSNYSRSSEWRNKPEESKKPKDGETGVDSLRQKLGRPPMMGLSETRSKTKSQDKVARAEGKERRNKIIEYLGQIDDAEKALLPPRRKGEDEESGDAVDTITSRDALLRKYGFELTSKDELLKLGGAADKKRRRQKRKILFPSSSSSSSGSDVTLDGKEVESTLKSFLGKGAEDIDVGEIVRHGRKWRNCFEDGECDCRPRNDKEMNVLKKMRKGNCSSFWIFSMEKILRIMSTPGKIYSRLMRR
uniref:Uncharacterized protein n=1 Tax=Lygus hesperus TaxID=30085 RepID=A0A0K8T509_LYGHE